ncbi:MAG: hypothetical protein ACLQBB_04275 [Solirubrobacteraceae bacterium]
MTGKLRAGELLALAGIVCVIVSLFEPWYQGPSGNLDLWDTFGVAAVLLLLALAAALAMVTAAATERDSPALAVATAVWCVPLALIGLIATVVRLLERPDQSTGLCSGAWFALAGSLAILVGAWLVLRDERPSRYRPARPEPRPRP